MHQVRSVPGARARKIGIAIRLNAATSRPPSRYSADDRGIDVVRNKIKMFATKKGAHLTGVVQHCAMFPIWQCMAIVLTPQRILAITVSLLPGKHKIVILDEADSMTKGAQQVSACDDWAALGGARWSCPAMAFLGCPHHPSRLCAAQWNCSAQRRDLRSRATIAQRSSSRFSRGAKPSLRNSPCRNARDIALRAHHIRAYATRTLVQMCHSALHEAKRLTSP